MSRPAKSGEAARARSIRLTDAEWSELAKRGGTDWLRALLANKK